MQSITIIIFFISFDPVKISLNTNISYPKYAKSQDNDKGQTTTKAIWPI